MSGDLTRRTRARMAAEGIPAGTDHPALLALGASPLHTITIPVDQRPGNPCRLEACQCHDSWDQCPCADDEHTATCDCCGYGICGARKPQ